MECEWKWLCMQVDMTTPLLSCSSWPAGWCQGHLTATYWQKNTPGSLNRYVVQSSPADPHYTMAQMRRVLTSWPTKILELSLTAGSTNSALSWYQRHREIMQLPQGHEASKWPSLQPISYPVYHISTLVKAKSVMGLGRQRKHSSKCSMTT